MNEEDILINLSGRQSTYTVFHDVRNYSHIQWNPLLKGARDCHHVSISSTPTNYSVVTYCADTDKQKQFSRPCVGRVF